MLVILATLITRASSQAITKVTMDSSTTTMVATTTVVAEVVVVATLEAMAAAAIIKVAMQTFTAKITRINKGTTQRMALVRVPELLR